MPAERIGMRDAREIIRLKFSCVSTHEIARRLSSMFLRDASGKRPVYGGTKKFQEDPYWKDYILFYEYFHGDNGAGLGASHQTGWTGVIARLLDLFARITPEATLQGAGKFMGEMTRQQVTGKVA